MMSSNVAVLGPEQHLNVKVYEFCKNQNLAKEAVVHRLRFGAVEARAPEA
jgi:hypothetical protein